MTGFTGRCRPRRITASAMATAAIAAGVFSYTPFGTSATAQTTTPETTANSASTLRCATGGEFTWAVRDSWLTYLQGSIASGGWTTSGIRDNGTSFTFTPTNEAESNTAHFGGTLHFTGHGGAIDMTLSDFQVAFSGSTAQITVDYTAYESDGQTEGVKGNKITGDDATIATISLANAADFNADTIDLTGTTTLSGDGQKLFNNFYQNGAEMAPTSGSITLGSDCVAASSTGSKDYGPGIIGEVNETLAGLNTMFKSTNTFLANIDSLYSKEWAAQELLNGNAGAGGAGTASGPGEGGAATATASGAGADTGTSTPLPAPVPPATRAGSAAVAPDGDQCVDSGTVGITDATLAWGVKESFRTYISGSIAKGGWQLSGVQYGSDQFIFPGASGSIDPATGNGTINLTGTVRFVGHNGTLNSQVTNPTITINGTSGSLLATVTSNDVEGNPHSYGTIELASLTFTSLTPTASSLTGTAQATLTENGAHAFGDFYTAGQALDPVTISATLGGAADCSTAGAPVAGSIAAPTLSSGSAASAAAALRSAASGSAPGNFDSSMMYEDSDSFQIHSIGDKNQAKKTTTENASALSSFAFNPTVNTLLALAGFGMGAYALGSVQATRRAGRRAAGTTPSRKG
ncbi:MAG: HtaA domain-containing protein [Corynebacterium sp.]|nr:HtaA domain-containing protein [Corynebacterium sp.]